MCVLFIDMVDISVDNLVLFELNGVLVQKSCCHDIGSSSPQVLAGMI
jgi:hypothetical protein